MQNYTKYRHLPSKSITPFYTKHSLGNIIQEEIMSYFDTSGASFNANLRMLETSDPCHADTFNALFGQLINNDVAIQKAAGGFASTKNA